jgi:hypothetical protein
MLIDQWKKAALAWVKEGYKFKRDKQGRCLMYLEGHKAIPISDQSYWFAIGVERELKAKKSKRKLQGLA